MKKLLLFATAFAILLTGCTKNALEQDVLDDGNPVPVRFNVMSPSSSLTKSTGAVESSWKQQALYIYGFDRAETDFTNTPFINNVQATAPDGSASGSITVQNDAVSGGAEPFYYVAKKNYDFYGYYIDDAKDTETNGGLPVQEPTRVYVPFVINGSQDLMLAKADQTADIQKVGASITEDRAYSAYAARRNVHPSLKFQHQLARFTFEIVAGAASGNNVNVDYIKVESKHKGNLVVVGTGRGIADVTEDIGTFTLQEINPEGNAQNLTPVKPNIYKPEKDNPKKIGESIMVIPGETSYNLKIKTSQDGTNTDIPEQEWTINIDDVNGKPEGATKFDAGYSYKITILIYGLEEVKFTAELEPWVDGGDLILDEDM